jgi:hypothetical protein
VPSGLAEPSMKSASQIVDRSLLSMFNKASICGVHSSSISRRRLRTTKGSLIAHYRQQGRSTVSRMLRPDCWDIHRRNHCDRPPHFLGCELGIKDWLTTDYRLLNLFFAAQSQLVDFTVRHDLKERYIRIDTAISKDHTSDVGLDIAGEDRRGTLIATAQAAFRAVSANRELTMMLEQRAGPTAFPTAKAQA